MRASSITLGELARMAGSYGTSTGFAAGEASAPQD